MTKIQVQVFNTCINSLANSIKKPRIEQLDSQVTNWMTSPNAEKSEAIKKADEVGQVMCNVIAPSDGDKLFQAVVSQYKGESGDEGLQVLVAETQIVRIYASSSRQRSLKKSIGHLKMSLTDK